DVPYKGILFSGFAMLMGLSFGLLFPRVYLVLITTGGFALLFTYAVIIASQIRARKVNGCPPEGKCQLPGFPYTSWIALISMLGIFISMPFIPGQVTGLVTGISMVVFYSFVYLGIKFRNEIKKKNLLIKIIKIKIRSRIFCKTLLLLTIIK
ncbi:MAG: amino acid permease, partial [Bacillales bacterium]|nr:amino acid permease [Bacillales bacterium]